MRCLFIKKRISFSFCNMQVRMNFDKSVPCTVNDKFELDIDLPNDIGLYHDYQTNNANNLLAGDLVQVLNVNFILKFFLGYNWYFPDYSLTDS